LDKKKVPSSGQELKLDLNKKLLTVVMKQYNGKVINIQCNMYHTVQDFKSHLQALQPSANMTSRIFSSHNNQELESNLTAEFFPECPLLERRYSL
jgi:hypothetical protein